MLGDKRRGPHHAPKSGVMGNVGLLLTRTDIALTGNMRACSLGLVPWASARWDGAVPDV